MHFLFVLLCLSTWAVGAYSNEHTQEQLVGDFFSKNGTSTHTNNWAVLVCSSRYWFNYRVRSNKVSNFQSELTQVRSIWQMPLECKGCFFFATFGSQTGLGIEL